VGASDPAGAASEWPLTKASSIPTSSTWRSAAKRTANPSAAATESGGAYDKGHFAEPTVSADVKEGDTVCVRVEP
jgi:hypothetical protein